MADIKQRFSELTRMHYIDQAKWFLNGFWANGASDEAESVWKYTHKCIELDEKKKKEGCELDEFQAHKFLEFLGETLTVVALREKLRKIDMDANGKMALLEYLAFKYGKTVQQIIDAPQGDNQDEVNEAQAKLEAVQAALNDLQKQLADQQTALDAQKSAEEEQRKTFEAQKAAEEAVRKAEAEQRAAVEDLERQEESYKTQIETLENKTKDSSLSTVQKSKASAELAQLKQEDPLPLRKAKITQQASLRKVEKERKAAEAASEKALAAKTEAEAKTRELEEQTRRVEEAVRDTEAKAQEAHDFLEEVKKKGGVAHGAIWWMEKELKEAQKFLPKKKQQL